jgi:putative transposase
MARHPRIIVPGVALHIRQRGNDRNTCFRSDADRLTYLSLLRDSSSQHGCALHAYCLMTNHVHLLVTPVSVHACALMMRDLGRWYSAYFNRRHERTGTLWEGRFRSCPVDSARYVLGCYRYIELNPVRAFMVSSPDAYPWSSYRANAGLAPDPSLSPHVEYTGLSPADESRHAAYRGLFDGAADEEFLKTVRSATRGGYPLARDSLTSHLKSLGVHIAPRKRGPRAQEKPTREVESLVLDL